MSSLNAPGIQNMLHILSLVLVCNGCSLTKIHNLKSVHRVQK